jgi:UDP-hydrolysing UDP-N-acetyl-D-glucosamine 2-epimerase
MTRRVAIPIATRGNHAKTKSIVRAMDDRDDVDAETILTGGAILARFGDYGAVMSAEGRAPDHVVPYLVDGETAMAMAQSSGRAVAAFAEHFARTRPDIVFVIADRYEALAFAQAAMCLNIPIAHLEGGEISGSIDERIRHAITKLSHIHLVASDEAAERLCRMGEAEQTVHVVGTPSFDLVDAMNMDDLKPLHDALEERGTGAPIDLAEPFVLVSLMPDVMDMEGGAALVEEAGAAALALDMQVVWLSPNMDAGSNVIAENLRGFRGRHPQAPIRYLPSLPFEAYGRCLAHALCFLGNSSSGIREGAFLGVPVVNIGTRQTDRRRGMNVVDCPADRSIILEKAREQIRHGRYDSDPLYGDGRTGVQVAEILATAPLEIDKRMTY